MLTIGHVHFAVTSDPPLLDLDNPSYQPFLDADLPDRPASTIRVRIVSTPAPSDDRPVLYVNGEIWKVQADPAGCRISFYRIGEHRPHTVCVCNPDTTVVQIHANQDVPGTEPQPHPFWNPLRYPMDQVLLMNHLAPRGGLIAHAAAAVVDGRAVVFPGRSGAGKSSIARLFMAAGLDGLVLNDDRVVIRIGGRPAARAEAEVWGTPWPGDAEIARNAGAPLAALCFLTQADETALVPLDPVRAMQRLIPVVSGPWYDRERGGQVMATCAGLVETFPCFDLRFRLHRDVVELVTGGVWDGGERS